MLLTIPKMQYTYTERLCMAVCGTHYRHMHCVQTVMDQVGFCVFAPAVHAVRVSQNARLPREVWLTCGQDLSEESIPH